jgi:hypothetical protein
MPEDASGNIALSMEECCMRSCHSSGFTQESCPDGTMARGEHDYHQPAWGEQADGTWVPGEFTVEECCTGTPTGTPSTTPTAGTGGSSTGDHGDRCQFGDLMNKLQHAMGMNDPGAATAYLNAEPVVAECMRVAEQMETAAGECGTGTGGGR